MSVAFEPFNGNGVRNWTKTIRRQVAMVRLNGATPPSDAIIVDSIVENSFQTAPEVKAVVKKYVKDQRATDPLKPTIDELLVFMLAAFKTGDIFAKTSDLDKIVSRYATISAGTYQWRSLTQLVVEKNEELMRPLPDEELVIYVKDALSSAELARRDVLTVEFGVWLELEMKVNGSGGTKPVAVAGEPTMLELTAAIGKYVDERQGIAASPAEVPSSVATGSVAAAAGLVPLPPSMDTSRRGSFASATTVAESDLVRELRYMFQVLSPLVKQIAGQGGSTGSSSAVAFQSPQVHSSTSSVDMLAQTVRTLGPCFYCGLLDHLKMKCPYLWKDILAQAPIALKED
ncbi:hypothetical protein HDU99_008524, partial [Rhizoclosmatium hyalinum]